MNTASNANPRFELSVVQLVAGCLAAITAAVLASFFGVAGTIIGTAMGSIVGTAGTAIYSHSLRRTQAGIRGLTAHDSNHATPRPDWRDYLRRSWVKIAVAAVAAFVIAMMMITGVEAAARRELSAIVTGHTQSTGPTTSVAGAFSGVSAQPTPTPSATAEPSSSPSPSAPAAAPTPTPGRSTPPPSTSPTPTAIPTLPPPTSSP